VRGAIIVFDYILTGKAEAYARTVAGEELPPLDQEDYTDTDPTLGTED